MHITGENTFEPIPRVGGIQLVVAIKERRGFGEQLVVTLPTISKMVSPYSWDFQSGQCGYFLLACCQYFQMPSICIAPIGCLGGVKIETNGGNSKSNFQPKLSCHYRAVMRIQWTLLQIISMFEHL